MADGSTVILLVVCPLLHNKDPEQFEAVSVLEPPAQIISLVAAIVGAVVDTVTDTGAELTLLQPSTLQMAV